MYLKYYLFSLVKLGALMTLPPYIAGFIAGIIRPKTALKFRWWIGMGFVILAELVVLVEKGAPFLFANLYFMFSLSPIVWLQYLLGVGGMIIWALFSVSLYGNGLIFSERFTTPSDNDK